MSRVDDVARRRSQLSPAKRKLLEKWLTGDTQLRPGQSTIPPRGHTRPAPLSFAQQRLWILDQLVPGNPFYAEGTALRIHVPLDIAIFEASLNEIVQRHEALRTTFQVIEDEPFQIVAPSMHLPLHFVYLSSLPGADREPEAQKLAASRASQPFDLSSGPLMRTTLIQLDQASYVFHLSMHHIVSDGWSLGIFVSELSQVYTDLSQGRRPSLPELPIQYADFAEWQRSWLDGEVLEEQLDYWRQKLTELPVLELPTDHPRPASFSYLGDYVGVKLGRELSAGLKELSRRHGVTLFMTMLAAFKVLLSRYTGQTDVVVGSPIANRNRAEIEGLIGFFVNTLVMRTDLSGDPSFEEVLKRVKEVAVQAYAHQDLPFEKLVGELQPERDFSRNPLFQVIFQVANTPTVPQQEEESELLEMEVKGGTAKFDLRVDLWEAVDCLEGRFEYSTDLFDEATIGRLISHYQRLLEGIVSDPAVALSRLPLLSEKEREQQLRGWNQTATDYPREESLGVLFEAGVEGWPQAVALRYGRQQMSYRQLNSRANQLASYLRERGSGPGSRVGVCLERTAEMVVAILGIIKAGAAYVPLDPEYPPERLAFMLGDAGVQLLISQGG